MKNASAIYLENIVNNLPHFIFWKDKESHFLGCNQLFAESAGFKSPKELIGKTDYEMPWKAKAADYVRMDRELMESKVSKIAFEEEQPQKDGSVSIMLVSKVPIFNEKQEVIGLVGIYMDITDRKQMEKNLIDAKEKAESASIAKTAFLENMRHDIRTPLTGIIGAAEMIQQKAKNTEIQEFTGYLFKSSEALMHYLNEILESIQVASGEIEVLDQKFDLKAKLQEVVNLLLAKAASKQVELQFSYDAALPTYVIGDPKRLHRIAMELVSNAITFTQEGYVKLSVTGVKQTDNKVFFLRMVIEDTGIGIPPEQRAEIFTRFKKLIPSYKGLYKGLGLGLYIVKEYIDDLGGEIYLDNNSGKGTTFTCIIPLKASLLQTDEGITH